MNLILLTNQFPTQEGDYNFIKTEWQEIVKTFDKIILISRSKKRKCDLQLPPNVVLKWYMPKKISIMYSFSAIFDREVRNEIILAKNDCNIRTYFIRIIQIIKYVCIERDFAHYIDKLNLEKGFYVYTYWLNAPTISFLVKRNSLEIKKIVSRVHGADLYQNRTKGDWQPFRNYISRNIDSLIFPCNKAFEYYKRHWSVLFKPIISYIGCSKKNRIEHKKRNKFILVSCSNMISLKRIDLIIKGLSKIKCNSIFIEWHHFGDGKLKKFLEDLSNELLKEKNISFKFWGNIPNELLGKYYEEIKPDLFITTTQTEGGAPISIQEAFSMGIPAIGTNVGGIPELIINHYSGMLLPESPSYDEVSRCIQEYIFLDEDIKEKYSSNAYNLWKEKFNSEKNAKEFISIIFKEEKNK